MEKFITFVLLSVTAALFTMGYHVWDESASTIGNIFAVIVMCGTLGLLLAIVVTPVVLIVGFFASCATKSSNTSSSDSSEEKKKKNRRAFDKMMAEKKAKAA